MQIFTHANAVAFAGLGRVQTESMRFFASRTAKDLAFAEQCAACVTAPEWFDLAWRYAAEASEDYFRAASQLFGVVAGQFENTASEVI